MVSVSTATAKTLRRLQRPGIVAGLDIGQRRDGCALVVVKHAARREGPVISHRWRVIDAWTAPTGTRSAEASFMIRDRLMAQTDVALVVDATGAGDTWIDHLVACNVRPALCVVVAAAGVGLRWSVDEIGGSEVSRVTVPRHPGGTGDTISLLGALETNMAIAPGAERPAVTVDRLVAESEPGRELRAQLAGLAWRKGRPDHESGSHDDLAFALSLALWSSGSTPGATKRPAHATFASAARRSIGTPLLPYGTHDSAWPRRGWP